MRWGKVVLIFQAVITLVIGMVFLSQLNLLDESEIQKIIVESVNPNPFSEESTTIIDLKQRYKSAAYILGVLSLIELIIISRLTR